MMNIEKLLPELISVGKTGVEEKDKSLCCIIMHSDFFQEQGRFCSLDCATCKALFLHWLLKEEK